jgi:hypothetical protein
MSSGNTELSGLQHLVDAATALSQLVSTVPSGNQEGRTTHMIRDDVETRRARLASQNQQFIMPSFRNVPLASNAAIPSQISMAERKSLEGHNPREIFPQRLMRMLSDHSIVDIITWLPHGRSFVIIQAENLADKILPKYFPESAATSKKSISTACKYPSFTRKLNRWGFRQVTRGPDAGAFHHKFFCRDEPSLCLQMICQRSRRCKEEKQTKDVINILPKKNTHPTAAESTAVSVTDSESISSGGSNLINAPPKRSFRHTNTSYHVKSPQVKNVANNLKFVSNNTSPATQQIPHETKVTTMTHIHKLHAQKQLHRPLPLNRHCIQQSAQTNAPVVHVSAPTKRSSSECFSSTNVSRQQPMLSPFGQSPVVAQSHSTISNRHPGDVSRFASNVEKAVVAAESSQISVSFSTQQEGGVRNGGVEDEEEARISKAKSMLYKAYLKALG